MPAKFSKEYNEANATIENNRRYLELIMDKNHFDALVLPVSNHGTATYEISTVANETISSNSGLPAITFPIGFSADGMPMGIEFIARKFHEGDLIALAYAYEQSQPQRILPTMPPANPLFEGMDMAQYNNFITILGYNAFNTVSQKFSEFKPDDKETRDAFDASIKNTISQYETSQQ